MPVKQYLKIIATTCIVGFGVWFGLLILTTFHGLLAEVSEPLFRLLSIGSRVSGVAAAMFSAVRRARKRAVAWPEAALFSFAVVSLSYFACLAIAK